MTCLDLRHRCTHRRQDLTKAGVGRVLICRVRIIGKAHQAWYYPEGQSIRYDVPAGKLEGLLACVNVPQSLRAISS